MKISRDLGSTDIQKIKAKVLAAIQMGCFLFLFLMAPLASKGFWDEDSIALGKKLSSDPLIPDPLLSTIWGYLSFTAEDLAQPSLYKDRITIKNPKGRELELPYKEHVSFSNQRPIQNKAKLVILLPGIFADSGSITNQLLQRDFHKQGYHSLALPNPWAYELLDFKPELMHSTLEQQAFYLARIAADSIKALDQKIRIESIEIFSISLGAFIAPSFSVYLNKFLSQERVSGLKISGLTTLSPPIRLSHAADNLDSMMDRLRTSQNNQRCDELIDSSWGMLRLSFAFLKTDIFNGRDNLFVRCAPSLTLNKGFFDGLRSVARLHYGSENTAEKIKSIRFKPFLNEVNPQYLAHEAWSSEFPFLDLVDRAKDKIPGMNVRILLSRDDFLNDGLDFEAFAKKAAPKELIDLAWGGHVGYMGSQKFKKLFRITF